MSLEQHTVPEPIVLQCEFCELGIKRKRNCNRTWGFSMAAIMSVPKANQQTLEHLGMDWEDFD